MSTTDQVLEAARRPFFSSLLWGPFLLVLVACAGILYFGHQLTQTLRQAEADAARAGGLAIAREIGGFLDREHRRLHAFVKDKDAEIRAILADSDNWGVIESLQTSVQRIFPDSIAFSVTGADGRPLFEDFEGLVGPTCQATMRSFAESMDFGSAAYEMPPIHPIPGAYHFDLVSPWRLDDGRVGVFFVSVAPDRIAELLSSAETASGMRYLLVNRLDPTLIEVSASGSREQMDGDFRLVAEGLAAGYFVRDLVGTHWRLLVLPDAAKLSSAVGKVYINVSWLVLALTLVSASLLVLLRRYERRNSSLFMRSLQSSVSRQRAILQSMVDGMVTIDDKGTILHLNPAVTRLFGYEARELLGANVRVLMPEPDRSGHDGYLKAYLSTGKSKILGKGREVTGLRKDGSRFPLLLTLGESIEGDQHIFVGILHDMTAYRDAQRKIVSQAIALERTHQELDEISQVAARNLQAPLQRIASLGETLGEVQASMLSSSEKSHLKRLADEARGMSEVAKGFADLTRVERAVDSDTIDLNIVLSEVQRDLAAAIAASAAVITVAPLPLVQGDSRQLRQLFWNLLDNAIKFRDPTRAPRIEVSQVSDLVEEDPGLALIQVGDNGLGIPPDKTDAVFDAFCRLQPRDTHPGIGLGLSFCRKIVEGLGGRISVQSTPGQGSCFTVTLPIPQSPTAWQGPSGSAPARQDS